MYVVLVAEDDGHLKIDHVAAALVALISQGQKKRLGLRLNLVALVGLQEDNEQLISSASGKTFLRNILNKELPVCIPWFLLAGGGEPWLACEGEKKFWENVRGETWRDGIW